MIIKKQSILGLLFTLVSSLGATTPPISPSPATLHQKEKSLNISKKVKKILKAVTGKSNPISMLDGDLDTETLPLSMILNENKKYKSSSIGSSIKSNQKKELYLTFDDGPLRGTKNVLNILQEEQVRATMFCIASHALRRKKIFRRETAMDNLLIANHTYSHANGHYSHFYSHTLALLKDIEHAQILIGGRKYLRLAGRNVWRLPKIKRNDGAIIALRGHKEVPRYDALSKDGYFIYGWDVEWHFNHRSHKLIENAQKLANHIESIYKRGRLEKRGKVVLLAHDFMFRRESSVNELRKFIHIMRDRGWKFKTIDHYSQAKPPKLYFAKYYKKKCKCIASKKINSTKKPAIAMVSFHKVISHINMDSIYKISSNVDTYKAVTIRKKVDNVLISSNNKENINSSIASITNIEKDKKEQIQLRFISLASYLKSSRESSSSSDKFFAINKKPLFLATSINGI